MAPLLPGARIFYAYLASAFVLAIVSYIYFSTREEDARPEGISGGMIRYLFDPRVWLHKSAQQDYVFFFFNGLIYYGVLAQLLVSGHIFFGVFALGLESVFGAQETAVFAPSTSTAVAFTLAVALVIDLAVWVTHYLQHKVIVLWQFHKVHHSAEVLTPATVYRMHPVDLLFTGLVSVVLTAFAFALFSYLTAATPQSVTVMNVNIIIFAFYLLGYNLRHSHIWLSYPAWLSYIFISPAQHQTHHSIDEKHYDKNFGLIFAFWDWLFGTLYVPKGYEKLEFGINREEPNPFRTITEIYLKPFSMAWDLVAPKNVRRTLICLAAVGGAAIVGGIVL